MTRTSASLTCAASVLLASAGTTLAQDTLYDPARDPSVGFNLISWHNFGSTGASIWQDAIQGLHDRGVREVSISPVRFYTPATGEIAQSSGSAPELAHIEAAVIRAKSLGMHVTLNPFVEPVNFTEWRGFYAPALGTTPDSGQPSAFFGPAGTFFDDYQDYLLEVAAIAETHDVDAMLVGTELRALVRDSNYNAQWTQTISAVDAVYSGRLGYAANWDNYANQNLTLTIWNHPAIDFVGIDAYFRDITSQFESDTSGTYPNQAFIDDVEQGWNALLDGQILPFAASVQNGQGLPVIFTELGYLPLNGTTVDPQNGSGGGQDSDEQAMAFEGFLRAVDGRLSTVTAAHVWQWQMPGNEGSDWAMRPDATAAHPENMLAASVLVDYASSTACAADFNDDGVLNNTDINAFVNAFIAGCTQPMPGPPTATLTQSQLLSMSTITGAILSATPDGQGVRFQLQLQDQNGFSSINLARSIFPSADLSSDERLALVVTLISGPPNSSRIVAKDGPAYIFNAGPSVTLTPGVPAEITLDTDNIASPTDVREIDVDFFGPDASQVGNLTFEVQIDPASAGGQGEPDCGPADMNADGVLNNTDINLFVQAFISGC